MHLKELKKKTPAELVEMAEELGVEGASTMRRQDLMFAILKEVAEDGEEILGIGTIEVLPDGFGFLRSPEANYLAGPTTSMSRPTRSASGACAPAIPSKAKSARPRTASAISRSR
jgi:transcription termination factor Rho